MKDLGAPLSLNEGDDEEDLPDEPPEVELSDEEVQEIIDDLSEDPVDDLIEG